MIPSWHRRLGVLACDWRDALWDMEQCLKIELRIGM